MSFKEKLTSFMRSRYGFGSGRADRINLCLVVLYFVIGIVNIFVRNLIATYILSAVSIAAVAYLIFRMFSRNISARRAENDSFCLFFRRIKDIGKARYRKCPNCRATLRLPKKRGSHTVCCPRCRQRFDVRILF